MSKLWLRIFGVAVLLIAAKAFWVVSTPNAVPVKKEPGLIERVQKNKKQQMPRGVWVTVFSKNRILYSTQAIGELVDYCKKNGINEIYLQIYRGGEAYYDSQIAGREKYTAMVASAGKDTIDHILAEAHKHNIKVFAWINVLSLAQNKQAPIIKKHGEDILTRDQNRRASIRTDSIDDSDKFYLRDDQLFLEPGDERVMEWNLSVVDEIVRRYPRFKGIHLDYIRYPYPVPSIPDGRFLQFGVTYGYGERNVSRFTKTHGLDPVRGDVYKNDLALKWDAWKRAQVTGLVERISALVREKAAHWVISCAVKPSQERAYSAAFQDWPLWLETGKVDHVVLMNYTRDERLSASLLKGALAFKGKGKVYAGVGVFLLKDASTLKRFQDIVNEAGPDGIVFFSYDELKDLSTSEKDKKG
jgi:uncharacterized lipoprotein YddW (UPF0748 family)